MIPVARLKKNLDFNRDLGDIIDVMKLAATLQFNLFRSNQEPFARFSAGLEESFSSVMTAQNSGRNRFIVPREGLPGAIVLVSSDEGFLGELNTVLINKLLAVYRENDEVIVVGQQGANYLHELGIPFSSYPSLGDKLDFGQIRGLRDRAFGLFNEGKAGRITVISSQFVNINIQQVESSVFLPLDYLLPARPPKERHDLIIEPNLDAVLEGWVKLWMLSRLYRIAWSSKLAEYAARIMHLDVSSRELVRLNRQLRLEYFKYLHGLSDKTIREIVAARIKIGN